jgi:hypothetical protein
MIDHISGWIFKLELEMKQLFGTRLLMLAGGLGSRRNTFEEGAMNTWWSHALPNMIFTCYNGLFRIPSAIRFRSQSFL